MRRESNYLLPNSDGSRRIALLSARSLPSESILLQVLQPNMSIPNSQMMMYIRLQASDELLLQIYKGQLCPLDHRQSHLGPISRLQDKGGNPKTKSHPQIPNPLSQTRSKKPYHSFFPSKISRDGPLPSHRRQTTAAAAALTQLLQNPKSQTMAIPRYLLPVLDPNSSKTPHPRSQSWGLPQNKLNKQKDQNPTTTWIIHHRMTLQQTVLSANYRNITYTMKP